MNFMFVHIVGSDAVISYKLAADMALELLVSVSGLWGSDDGSFLVSYFCFKLNSFMVPLHMPFDLVLSHFLHAYGALRLMSLITGGLRPFEIV